MVVFVFSIIFLLASNFKGLTPNSGIFTLSFDGNLTEWLLAITITPLVLLFLRKLFKGNK